MTPLNAETLVAQLVGYAADPEVGNLHAQAHARAILQELGSPPTAWPKFRADLDERLYYGAHFQIWTALELLEQGKSKAEAQQALLNGAEGLEFLCEDSSLNAGLRSEQLLKAAFAYYIAGHYARSYVLINELSALNTDLPLPLALLLSIIQKHFQAARNLTLEVFSDETLSDLKIAGELEAGTIEEDEALSRMIFTLLTSAVSLHLEYLKLGERALFDEALGIVNDMVSLARENLFVDWWWWSFCLRHLLLEYDGGSLWGNLSPQMGGGQGGTLLPLYVRGGLRRLPPIVELWPSQVQAVPMINRPDRPHLCLKMPTSSGKTQIAEMAILRFVMDKGSEPSSKCAYIAPFRSLAVEVEKTLRKSLAPLGIRVSEIYGGFDLSSEDRRLIEETNILIATPEKFDAFFRYAPELGSGIGLVIIDEGHVVNLDQRGLHFEFFLQRLLKRLASSGCRFLFISAVLPNASEFAEWITGEPNNLLESKWRPSRLMLGQLSWDGRAVRIDYTHSEREEFKQECFVPRFITAEPCKGVPGLGKRQLPFPKNKDEAFAAAALRFATTGTTLVFCPQKRQAQAFARTIKQVLEVRQALELASGSSFEIPKPGDGSPEWERCRNTIETEMGPASELLNLLEAGIVLHHAGLPQRVRIAIEDLVRSRGVQLLVATTTLAQGVNLPIKTVLVRGLYHGHGDLVSPLTFWNISGRAGRGMQETEGQILFCVDRSVSPEQLLRTNRAIRKMISAIETAKVESAVRWVLSQFVLEWCRTHPRIEVPALCLHLAEHSLGWISEERRAELHIWLDRLDGHLLALTEDFDLDPYTPDKLQEILSGSLLFIQLRDDQKPILTLDEAIALLDARIKYIYHRHPNRLVRARLFKLGLPLADCETIESNKESLLVMFLEATDWSAWSPSEKVRHLIRIADTVLTLRELRPPRGLPPQSHSLLEAWLLGSSSAEMAADGAISPFSNDPAEISLWIEDVCRYRLPWGINSLCSFLQSYALEYNLVLPPVCAHFASMFKYGVVSSIAVRLIPYLDQERTLANLLADVYPLTIDDTDEVYSWFISLDQDQLLALGIDGENAARITHLQLAYGSRVSVAHGRTYSFHLSFSNAESTGGLKVGEKVLIIPLDNGTPNACALWTLKGKMLGTFALSGSPIPLWWKRPDLVISSVAEVKPSTDGKVVVSIQTSEV